MRSQREGGWCRQPRSVVALSLAVLVTAAFAAGGPATTASTAPASRPVLQPTSTFAFRREPPPATEQAAARRRVDETVVAEAKGTSLDARVALAHKLRARAARSFGSPADEFALLTAAVDAARDAPDLYLCFRLIDATAMAFRVDASAMKADAVVRVAARVRTTDTWANWYNYWAADELAARLMEAEDFAAAAKVAAAATLLGAGKDATRRDAEKLVHQVKYRQEASAAVEKYRRTLRTSPDDAAANLAVGRYLSLVQREWEAAAPLLLKANDRAFAPIARAMVRKPSPTDFEQGNLWWDAAEAETDLGFRRVEHFFAYGYYTDALRPEAHLSPADVGTANDRIAEYEQFDKAQLYACATDRGPTCRQFTLSAAGAGEDWVPLAFEARGGYAYHLSAHGRWSASDGVPCGPDGAGKARGQLVARIVPAATMPALRPVEFVVGSDELFVAPLDGRLELRMNDPGPRVGAGRSGQLDVRVIEIPLEWWNAHADLSLSANPAADATLVIDSARMYWQAAPGSATTRGANAPFGEGEVLPTRLNDYLWPALWADDGTTYELPTNTFDSADGLVATGVQNGAVTLERPGSAMMHVHVKPHAPRAADGVRWTLSYGSDSPDASTQPSSASAGPTTRPASPADIAAAEARALQAAEGRVHDLEARCNIQLRRVQTDHFTIFTDWDPANDRSLKATAEWAYLGVNDQFNKVVHLGPVRCGTVPVILLARDSEFWRLYHELDGNNNLDGNYAGYQFNAPDGFGRIAMSLAPPGANGGKEVRDAEWRLGNMWAHELTHEYVARCRSPREITNWVNEGLAEVVASRVFRSGRSIYPDVEVRSFERRSDAARVIEESRHVMSDDDYPLSQTAVETMLVIDPDAFVAFFNDLKDGVAPEDALRARFKMDFARFEATWKHRVAKLTGAE